MRVLSHTRRASGARAFGFLFLGFLLVLGASCRTSHEVTVTRRPDPSTNQVWPKAKTRFRQASYRSVSAKMPTIEGAEYVNDDELCLQCHKDYAESFHANNVHRQDSCEACHGPASKHLKTRGKEPGMIFSFRSGDPIVLAEACLKCHEEHQCTSGAQWRTSTHAHRGITCVDCHRGHYDVRPGTPAFKQSDDDEVALARPLAPRSLSHDVATPDPSEGAQILTAYLSENLRSGPERLPPVTQTAADARPPVDTNIELVAATIMAQEPDLPGYERPERDLPSLRGTSHHLGAVAPGVCYRCHAEKQELQQIAGPHQIGGPNGFNCTTCHNPHGQIIERTRKDLCLECHTGSPTMAWHSSIHAAAGVACTDCHNPHPRSKVSPVVAIEHTNIIRPKRVPMAVDDPFVCYTCHTQIFAKTSMPSHHPIKEGKMLCADCHDAHGQALAGLKFESVNLVCYRCHAEKQGPFTYEHPPVTENCAICHDPHGAVANNLLHQPPVFLCLRCHTGHRTGPSGPNHTPLLGDVGQSPALQRAFYSDCTQCHTQIHGSDLPSPHVPHVMFR